MYLAMFGLLIVLLFAMMSMDKPVSTMKYYEVLDYFKQGKVEEYQIDYDNGNLTMKIEGKISRLSISSQAFPSLMKM